MGWGNSASKWGRKPTRDRGPIEWKDNSGAKPAPFVQVMPRYAETREIPAEFQEYLYIGALWTANQALAPDPKFQGTKCPVLQGQYWQPESALIKAKSFMIYAGIIRLEERESNGRIVNVLRHTFVAGDGRYVVSDFSLVRPVV
jgi:hypothetical protein